MVWPAGVDLADLIGTFRLAFRAVVPSQDACSAGCETPVRRLVLAAALFLVLIIHSFSTIDCASQSTRQVAAHAVGVSLSRQGRRWSTAWSSATEQEAQLSCGNHLCGTASSRTCTAPDLREHARLPPRMRTAPRASGLAQLQQRTTLVWQRRDVTCEKRIARVCQRRERQQQQRCHR